ncbi:MAG: crotonase/enoyl-CoA hydratase family protein [Pseudomonadota bacterium]
MNERISIQISGGVADVRLNRPDKMNALDPAMFEALINAGATLRTTKGIRAVVLSGEGRAFCAGLDMASFASLGTSDVLGQDLMTRTFGTSNAFQHVCMLWRELPMPVIAAVHGVAFGGGLQVALGADMRFVAPDARMSVMEIKWGLVPDMGGMVLMRELARADVLRELTFTGRQFSGDEALRLGFATQLHSDPHGAAMAAAAGMAQSSPAALRAAKRLFNGAADQDAGALLLAESHEQDLLIGSPSQMEAVMANMEKRPPRFLDE